MLDLDGTTVCKECVMMCTELQYEDADKDIVVYGDQVINTDEYEKATHGDLTKTQSKEEEEVKYNVAQSTNNSVLLERKRRQLNESTPDKKAHGVSQTDTSINENHTENSFNNVTMEAQGPVDDNNENESWKAWTMEMQMNDSDVSMGMMNEPEQVSEEDKKFLYARAVHSNHSIQYHMQQRIERQKVVDEYRSMTMEGMGLTPLESNLHKCDLVVISQIMQMIKAENFWHQKTFDAVLTATNESMNRKMCLHTVWKTVKSMMNWTEWKLLACAVKARLKMVNNAREKKAQSKKVRTK